jgi:hypothetical protein
MTRKFLNKVYDLSKDPETGSVDKKIMTRVINEIV